MDAELEIRNLKMRLDALELQIYDLAFCPSESDEKIQKIIEVAGEHLRNKTWSAKSNTESINAAYWIAHAFNDEWTDKNNQSELQYLIGAAGKTLRIENMPSYTAVLDWIKAFEYFSKGSVKLIGKSVAIKLAKAGASSRLREYALMSAEHNDPLPIGKIKELIEKERKAKEGDRENS